MNIKNIDKKALAALIAIPVLIIVVIVAFLIFRKHTPSQISNSNINTTETSESNPKLEILNPNVFIETSGSSVWAAALEGQEIKTGDSVKTDTDGKAQIIYPSGTVTRLDSNTEITLKDYEASPQQVDIMVQAGTIWSRITKLLGGESYQSESKNLVASVRGTVYTHEVLPSGEDKISVTSHTVHVNCGKGQEEADVTENSETETNCREKPVLARIPAAEKLTPFVKLSIEEDKKLIERFRNARYDDSDVATTSATPIIIPTHSPSPTPKPSMTPSPSATPTSSPTPTPTLTPLSVTSVTLICGATISTSIYYPCGDTHTKIDVKGTGFAQGITVWAIPVVNTTNMTYVAPSPTPIESDYPADKEGNQWPQISGSTDLIAHFSALLRGTYYVRVVFGNQVVDSTKTTFYTY